MEPWYDDQDYDKAMYLINHGFSTLPVIQLAQQIHDARIKQEEQAKQSGGR